MIPKIIHYCWFGGKPLPKLAEKCIASWKKHCPDYEIKRWDESNFDVNMLPYTKEAYQAKKYAFVSDVARLWAISQFGGIYMDTDVEVLKPLDRFLVHPAFCGFEEIDRVLTGILASEKNGVWATGELARYTARHFLQKDGTLDLTTNVKAITENLKKHGLQLNNIYQELQGVMVIYPKEYFCPIVIHTGRLDLTKNSCAIHHCDGSWMPVAKKTKKKLFFVLDKIHPALIPAGIAVKNKIKSLFHRNSEK